MDRLASRASSTLHPMRGRFDGDTTCSPRSRRWAAGDVHVRWDWRVRGATEACREQRFSRDGAEARDLNRTSVHTRVH